MLLVAADTAFRLGDWDAADAAALEGLQATGEVGQPAIAGWLLTIRVRILAAQGRHEEGRAAAQAGLRIAKPTGSAPGCDTSTPRWASSSSAWTGPARRSASSRRSSG